MGWWAGGSAALGGAADLLARWQVLYISPFLFSERLFRGWGHRATVQQFLSHLRKAGRILQAPAVSGQASPAQRIERRYQRFILDERGLAPTTMKAYSCVVRAFLTECFGDCAVSLEQLTIRDVNRFILGRARRST